MTVLGLLLSQHAQAQWTYTIDTSLYVSIMADSVRVAETQADLDAALRLGAGAPQTTFAPSVRLSVEAFAQSLGTTPAEVQALAATLHGGLDAFEQEALRLERPHNVALAFAYLVGVCYLVYHGEEPSEAALLNLQASTDATLGAADEFRALTDVQRQEFYETMVLLATLPLVGYVTALEQQDAATMESYRAVAAATLESILGMHPDRLRFTEVGLEVRP